MVATTTWWLSLDRSSRIGPGPLFADLFHRVSPRCGCSRSGGLGRLRDRYAAGRDRYAGLPAVRARFRTADPTPNWGAEYAIGKADRVFRIYISQPQPDIEAVFDTVVRTLEWPGP